MKLSSTHLQVNNVWSPLRQTKFHVVVAESHSKRTLSVTSHHITWDQSFFPKLCPKRLQLCYFSTKHGLSLKCWHRRERAKLIPSRNVRNICFCTLILNWSVTVFVLFWLCFTFSFFLWVSAFPLILIKHFHTPPDKQRPETVTEVDCEETVSAGKQTVRHISSVCVSAVSLKLLS